MCSFTYSQGSLFLKKQNTVIWCLGIWVDANSALHPKVAYVCIGFFSPTIPQVNMNPISTTISWTICVFMALICFDLNLQPGFCYLEAYQYSDI